MHLKTKHIALSLLLAFCTRPMAFSQVRLPKLISDGMVLQRNSNARLWGWAAPGRRVFLSFVGSDYETVADSSGSWDVVLPKLKAGGPYTLTLIAGDTVKVKDILIGDVWVCSGQSNMELPMRRVSPIYESEIAHSTNENIRYFNVPQKYDFNRAHADFESGVWWTTNPQTVLNYSAVAYFFAAQLYEKYHIPIGLINASLGGSPAEAWMSVGALKAFPKYYEEAQRFKDSALIRQIEESDRKRIRAWYDLLRQKDLGYKNPKKTWLDPDFNDSRWATMKLPGSWAQTKLGPVNGVVWFRKEVRIPKSMLGKKGKLILGRIVDADSVFINGIFVGTTSYQYPPRRYDIPPDVLKPGENLIVVRVISNKGKGGFVPDKPYELRVGNEKIDLKGNWKYRLGAAMSPLADQTFIRWKPLGLYNAMIAPLLNDRIEGVIWYQGESNAERPLEYRELFPALIRDWRNDWHQGDFPFLFVQLPNFMEAKKQPSESNWALLREAQLKTLSLPNTAMAVTIDIGEWNDIHPLDKKDVGKRLALAAEKVAYGDGHVVYSGPLYQSMKIEGKKILLTFSDVGGGLMAKGGGQLKCFAIAGADRRFVWADAKIEGDKVVVWSDRISKPVAVRYAWADNPEGANLYNMEGLPASPFRTDEFK
jgi:sialate O-acetylesterase